MSEVVFRYDLLTRLPLLAACTVFAALGLLISVVQLGSAAAGFQTVVLGLFSVVFGLMMLFGWAAWGTNLFSGPAARLTPASAELRGYGSQVVIDRLAPGLTLEWLMNGLLVSPATAVTIRKRGLLRARLLPDGRAWVPIEHRAVRKGAALVRMLNGGGGEL